MSAPKADALPLGDAPISFGKATYITFFFKCKNFFSFSLFFIALFIVSFGMFAALHLAITSFSFALPATLQQTQLNYLIEQTNYQKLEAQTISSISTSFY